jgi:signal transduction histidine kinase
MNGNPLQLAEGGILLEQLRLVMQSTRNTVLPFLLMTLVLIWALVTPDNVLLLSAWGVMAVLSNFNRYRIARRYLASGIPLDQAHRLVWIFVAMSVVGGSLWGLLAWLTLGSASLVGSILVIAVLASVASGAVSTHSAVLPVYISFLAPMQLLCAVKGLTMGDPMYRAMGVISIFYATILVGQARNSARSTRSSIELRFENLDLLEKLRQETEHAKSARLEAEQAQREAEQANAAKSKFLAAASHDLRQPIHAQGLFLDVLSRTPLDAPQRQLLDSVKAASTASSEMLNTLLDFSRIDAGVVEPQVTVFRVQSVLNKIEREFAQQADDKGLSYHSRESALVVRSDPALVELILRNLVSNAIRYTERGGLLVACRQHGDLAVLEVWDTGIGIAPAHQQDVFREFHQLGNPQRDRHNGLGLGLAIVQALAHTLGHPLSLKSSLHRGSVFRLALPVATAALMVEAGAPELGLAQLIKVRVLVLEDDEAVRQGMLHLLRDWGCECEGAADIEDALALALRLVPQVVISDYRLREHRTGVQAIAALRAVLGADLPALLVTGDTAPERLREAVASGIPLLHKPVSPGQLYRALVTAMPH